MQSLRERGRSNWKWRLCSGFGTAVEIGRRLGMGAVVGIGGEELLLLAVSRYWCTVLTGIYAFLEYVEPVEPWYDLRGFVRSIIILDPYM